VTIPEAALALRSRQISCRELTEHCLDQIAKLDPRLNAFLTVTAEQARAQAAALDRELADGQDRGPLHGIPIAHKDLIHTQGIRTTSGSKFYADFVPADDAPVVSNLARAGAVLVGKTGLHECAYGVTSENPHFGVIRNPHDPERTPGGSSGGSAVAVACQMAFQATGTDTGGSIRLPASYCGVVGLKPTYGLVDRSGIQPLGSSLDHIGPITRSVACARLSLDAMAPRRPRSAPRPLAELCIGLPENFYFAQCSPAIRDAVHRAASQAEALGARVETVRVPDIASLNAVSRLILLVEASALYEPYWSRREDFGADVLALIDQGRLVPATAYVNAQRLRKSLAAEFRAVFHRVDFLFTPTTPATAQRIGARQIELAGEMIDARVASTSLVRAINVIGFPALSLPCGQENGLPFGLQIVARPYEEDLLFAIGEALEPRLAR